MGHDRIKFLHQLAYEKAAFGVRFTANAKGNRISTRTQQPFGTRRSSKQRGKMCCLKRVTNVKTDLGIVTHIS